MNEDKILFQKARYVMRIGRLFGGRITKNYKNSTKITKITKITQRGSYRIYSVLFRSIGERSFLIANYIIESIYDGSPHLKVYSIT